MSGPSPRVLLWRRIRIAARAIEESTDPDQVAERGRELAGLVQELEEWQYGPGYVGPVVLNDPQLLLAMALVELAHARKSGNVNDPLRDARARYGSSTAEELKGLLASFGDAMVARVAGATNPGAAPTP